MKEEILKGETHALLRNNEILKFSDTQIKNKIFQTFFCQIWNLIIVN